jgi:maltooligosyltrehalose trehalohydrolase
MRGPDDTFIGCWSDLHAGDRYWFRVDGRGPYPDPASRFQPCGVHGPSMLVDPGAYAWRDGDWTPPRLADAIIYELHVGTFTPEGTFAAAQRKLPVLAALGVTVLELMPIAAFPGARNWGYDGVALFAPAACYGTPDEFRSFVDTAHELGLAVMLDVVYNHLGPDGAYHTQFASDFLAPGGPWGAAINFQGSAGERVREFCLDNARHWIREYHIDGLRLDATHAYHDAGSRPFTQELVEAVRAHSSKPVLVIAEDDRNDASLLHPISENGCGLDAVWADDFHHHLRRLLTGDADGYFESYAGTTAALADTIEYGWFFRGQWSPYHGRARGTLTAGTRLEQFVFCVQNHDQVGNRAIGDRLHHAIDLAAWRAASALLLWVPETPLLFMGQEWAATSPFRYFTDHAGDLGVSVTAGRRKEFERFRTYRDHPELVPDPQAAETADASRLDWGELAREPHASTWRLYQELIAIRRNELVSAAAPPPIRVHAPDADSLVIERVLNDQRVALCVIRLRGSGHVEYLPTFGRGGGCDRVWRMRCSTEEPRFAPGPSPIDWSIEGTHLTVHFERPGALLLLA